jgi:hypothetical protein
MDFSVLMFCVAGDEFPLRRIFYKTHTVHCENRKNDRSIASLHIEALEMSWVPVWRLYAYQDCYHASLPPPLTGW